jgi:uncharacterized membrane protein
MKIKTIVVTSAIFLFLCSSLRHMSFHSTAYDLGIFDQAVYLISRGEPSVPTLLDFHILGDHAALIWYPISLLYKIYPSVYWLFGIQSIALSVGAYYVYRISLNEGLKEKQSSLMALVYLLYPTVISINFFDFHPDTIALPCYFWLILIARQSNPTNKRSSLIKFLIGIAVILSCKAALSLTIIAMGIWLIIFQKKRIYGTIAISLAMGWFIIATQLIIPYYSSNNALISRHLIHYGYLGNSFAQIITNIFLNPQIIITQVFSWQILFYLFTLVLSIIWGLSFKHLSPILCTIPQLLIIILSSSKAFNTVGYQYTLPMVPFLILVVITNIKYQDNWLKNKRIIVVLIAIGFLISFRPHIDIGSNIGRDFSSLTYSLQASQKAVAKVHELDSLRQDSTKGSVLTTAKMIPHLSHRSLIKVASETIPKDETGKLNYGGFDYILLNVRYPILTSTREFAQSLAQQIKTDSRYQLAFQESDVYLFVKNG